MRNIKAVFIKQMLSFLKNSGRWGLPATFLVIPFAISLLLPVDNMNMVVAQFISMFVGIAMIGTASGFIAEDRVTMNLRFMGMAGVKPYQYLVGTAGTLIIVSFVTLVLFGIIGQFSMAVMQNFMIIAMLGAVNSMLLGITFSLTRFAPFSPIVGILLGVGPMFSEANETLANIFSVVYTYQMHMAVRDGFYELPMEVLQIVLINLAVLVVLFVLTNLRYGLDGERLAGS